MKPSVDIKRKVAAKSVENVMEKEFDEPGNCEGHPEGHFLIFACPGCGDVAGIACNHPKPHNSPSWDIKGGSLSNPEGLTLDPSINCIGCCGWHGYLRNGIFEPC